MVGLLLLYLYTAAGNAPHFVFLGGIRAFIFLAFASLVCFLSLAASIVSLCLAVSRASVMDMPLYFFGSQDLFLIVTPLAFQKWTLDIYAFLVLWQTSGLCVWGKVVVLIVTSHYPLFSVIVMLSVIRMNIVKECL